MLLQTPVVLSEPSKELSGLLGVGGTDLLPLHFADGEQRFHYLILRVQRQFVDYIPVEPAALEELAKPVARENRLLKDFAV